MKVELLDIFGDDKMVVNCARVSFLKEASNYTEDQNTKLLNYLVNHNHIAPFFHPQLQFRITCPIYVERQIFKTQIGVVVNSLSGRYVDFSDSYTKIGIWRKQSKSSKQGSEGNIQDQETCKLIEEKVINVCKEAYSILCEMGVAKEQCRTLLPLNLNTTFIWTGSLYAFIRLCGLRLKPDAQYETQLVVQEMLHLLKETDNFKQSIKAFNL